jgi:dihydrodipicolinate synthase/N-acetylneuraminate lyase
VSDSPWDAFAPYLLEGLDVFVGPEALISQGMRANAVGAVSALASAFPERVAAAVRDPDGDEAKGMADLRAAVERFPRHAALKRIVARKGVPIREDVRAPLRPLRDDEREELDRWLESS